MADIEPSKQSPRFDDDTDILYWFSGDAFCIDWRLVLTDPETHETHSYAERDKIIISFFDKSKKLVHKFEADHIDNATVTTAFTPEISAKFPIGSYTYCIKYEWTDTAHCNEHHIQTLVDNKVVKVEACH